MSHRVLISGGAGFVGRTLVRLLAKRCELCVIDLMKFGEERFSASEFDGVRLERIDLRDGDAVGRVVRDFAPDIIIHLAATHFIPACENDPGEAVSTNVLGTVHLLAACPPGCRFVFASSGAVYSPSETLHDEMESLVGPLDVYGFTKLQGEQYLTYFAQKSGFPAVAVRLFNVIGPGETNPHLLPELVAQMKAGRLRIALGNLWPKRDYIDVRDAASGFAAAALAGTVASGETAIVNLGTSRQSSVSEIVERLREISGLPIVVEEDPARVRPVDRPFLGAAIGRIEQRFGWTPQYGLDESLGDLWRDPDFSRDLRLAYGL